MLYKHQVSVTKTRFMFCMNSNYKKKKKLCKSEQFYIFLDALSGKKMLIPDLDILSKLTDHELVKKSDYDLVNKIKKK